MKNNEVLSQLSILDGLLLLAYYFVSFWIIYFHLIKLFCMNAKVKDSPKLLKVLKIRYGCQFTNILWMIWIIIIAPFKLRWQKIQSKWWSKTVSNSQFMLLSPQPLHWVGWEFSSYSIYFTLKFENAKQGPWFLDFWVLILWFD